MQKSPKIEARRNGEEIEIKRKAIMQKKKILKPVKESNAVKMKNSQLGHKPSMEPSMEELC